MRWFPPISAGTFQSAAEAPPAFIRLNAARKLEPDRANRHSFKCCKHGIAFRQCLELIFLPLRSIDPMTPTRLSRSPSPAPQLSMSPAIQPARTQNPAPTPPAPPATALNPTTPIRHIPSETAAAARLRDLAIPQTPRTGSHKREPSKDADTLARETGRAIQASRQSGPDSSPGISANTPGASRYLRHATSTSDLIPPLSLEKQNRSLPVNRAGDLAETRVKNDLKRQIEQTDFWKGEDRPGLIRMKKAEGNTGVAESTRLLAGATLVRLPKLGFNPKMKFHSKLIRQDDGSCLLENPETKQMNPPIDGQGYIFVTMPGAGPAAEIRVCPKANGGHGHAQVSGYAPYVRYAGEVIFKDGKEIHATPQSGTYLPPLENARTLSGLNCEFTSEFPSNSDQAK